MANGKILLVVVRIVGNGRHGRRLGIAAVAAGTDSIICCCCRCGCPSPQRKSPILLSISSSSHRTLQRIQLPVSHGKEWRVDARILRVILWLIVIISRIVILTLRIMLRIPRRMIARWIVLLLLAYYRVLLLAAPKKSAITS